MVLEVAALVGEQHDLGARLGELAHRRGAALDPGRVAQTAASPGRGRVDVDPAEHDLARDVEVVEGVDAVLHGLSPPPASGVTSARGTGW